MLRLLEHYGELPRARGRTTTSALVVGRSRKLGAPLAAALRARGAEVNVAHSEV